MPYQNLAYKNVLRRAALKFITIFKTLQRKVLKKGQQLLRKVVVFA